MGWVPKAATAVKQAVLDAGWACVGACMLAWLACSVCWARITGRDKW